MCNTIKALFLLLYSVSAFADYLPYFQAIKLYDLSDLVFIGSLIRIEKDNLNNPKYAFLRSLLTIKGAHGPEIRLCNDDMHPREPLIKPLLEHTPPSQPF